VSGRLEQKAGYWGLWAAVHAGILGAMFALPILVIAGFLLFAGASFAFALAETALFTLGKWQTEQLAEREGDRGRVVARLLATPQDLLATIVLGNTFASAGLVSLGLWVVLNEEWPPLATSFGVLVLILVGGEVIPKTLAVRSPQFWALRVARPMALLQTLTRPLHWLARQFNTQVLRWAVPESMRLPVTGGDEEYAELLELGFQQGALAQSEKEIILQIINLDRHTAKDVMRPRAQMHALPDDLPVSEMIAAARRYKHRRLPLYDETPDTIVGILNTRELLLNPEQDLSEIVDLPSFVPETTNLLRLLQSLQRQRRGVAIVVDEYGSTSGLVTTEDILGSMVGRIQGEGEAEGFVVERLGAGQWRVSGTMRLEDFRREYPDLGQVPDVDTMGGLLVAVAEVVPPAGHAVRFGNLRLRATQVDDRRVRELVVEDYRKTGGAAI